ncbi:MAG: cyclopropane fatty acyl phospholipid synthase [Gammaproteobacteria bacterium]
MQENPDRMRFKAPEVLQELADMAGVTFNGDASWDIQVHDNRLFDRILTKGSLGFGEAYMDGMWDSYELSYELDELFHRLLRAGIDEKLQGLHRLRLLGEIVRSRLINRQSTRRAFQVGEQHYDTGNDLFEAMLDPTMSYSCGYWEHASTLEEAQLAKLDMICRKLQLSEGDHVLEIGCGWGSFARYAAENYGVEVTGVTVSKEQQKLAQDRCTGLPVNIMLMDYRDISGRFDKAVSIGMFEHVGQKNYATYFEAIRHAIKEDGLFLLHTIGTYRTVHTVDPWIDKYIFPNGKLPSASEISEAIEGRFLIEDWHNFGPDYDKTLMAWWENFDAAWPALSEHYSERFYRMWKYYLLACAGLFRSRHGQLWQLVLSKRENNRLYRSVRPVPPAT